VEQAFEGEGAVRMLSQSRERHEEDLHFGCSEG